MSDTLVLSQSYQPVARISWQRAVTLLTLGKIEIIEEYEDREVRSMTFSMKVPSIVRFLNQIRRKKKAIKFSRENVYARDKAKCQYCRNKVTRTEATYDHVVPRSLGGRTNWDNIVISCKGCNQKKGGRTPTQAKMPLHVKPVRPKNLPNYFKFSMKWTENMPPSWKDFVHSYSYWHGDIEEK
jgi:5-methylcytosine-specific restriction endonuclease McrA